MIIGILLIAAGIIALLVNAGTLTGTVWSYFWPAALIIFGLSFFFRRAFWGHPRHWRHWHDDGDEGKKD